MIFPAFFPTKPTQSKPHYFENIIFGWWFHPIHIWEKEQILFQSPPTSIICLGVWNMLYGRRFTAKPTTGARFAPRSLPSAPTWVVWTSEHPRVRKVRWHPE